MSNDFLALLETVRVEDASIQRMFGGEGQTVRSMRRDDPRYRRAFGEAVDLIERVASGRTPMYRLQEAMSTSDFPLLFADALDRQLLGRYAAWPAVWARTARRGTVRDFRTAKRFTMDGAEAPLGVVGQGEEYPESALTEGKYEYSVRKFGRRVPFLWETFVNDDLDSFRDTPDRLANAARNTEERFGTELYVDTTGPDAVFFAAGNGNRIITGGAGLDLDKLEAGLQALWAQKDADGNPIYTGPVRLVVPPKLTVKAMNILNATQVATSPGATSGQQVLTSNWTNGVISELVINPWLPIVDVSANKDTTWYLFADPGVGRPAYEVGFLRGYETPQLFMKSPNATRVGGGAVAAEDGDFEADGISFKVRHVIGGSLLDPKAAVAYIGV